MLSTRFSRFVVAVAVVFAATIALTQTTRNVVRAAAPDAAAVKKEQEKLQGVWAAQEVTIGGQELPKELTKTIRLTLKGDRYEVPTPNNMLDKGVVILDPTTTPRSMSIKGEEGPNKGKTMLAIYELNGDELKVCYDIKGEKTPASFTPDSNSQLLLIRYKRESK